MIYMEPSQLGWVALHKSYLLCLEEKGVSELNVGLFEQLTEWLIPPALHWLQTVDTVLKISEMHHYSVGESNVQFFNILIVFFYRSSRHSSQYSYRVQTTTTKCGSNRFSYSATPGPTFQPLRSKAEERLIRC